MGQKLIPKMTYIVKMAPVGENVLKECLRGIMRQSNVEKILFLNSSMLLDLKTDKWYAIIEPDVYLSKDWIERMWKYNEVGDIIMGRVVSHPIIKLYKEKQIQVGKPEEPYLQSTLWCAGGMMTVSEAIYDRDAEWIEVPVVDYHCPSYKHNPFIQGMKDPVGIKRILRTILGGIKITIMEGHWIFAWNAILRGAGMVLRRVIK